MIGINEKRAFGNDNEKEKFEVSEIEIIIFGADDIITTSGLNQSEYGLGDEFEWQE